MNKDDLIRFLKEIGKTTLEFNPNIYKSLNANEYHWDKYLSGDIYDLYETDDAPFYRYSDLTKLDTNSNTTEKYLDNMIAACDVDNLLIIFLGYHNEDSSLDLYATEHLIDYPAYRLLAIFKLDELSKYGFIIKINFREEARDAS
jgi:hypothetical protein